MNDKTINKLSQWYTGCIWRGRINELEGSTESEASRSQHSKIKEKIMKEVKGKGGQKKFRNISSERCRRKQNGQKMMFGNKMTDNFPEMKTHMKTLNWKKSQSD